MDMTYKLIVHTGVLFGDSRVSTGLGVEAVALDNLLPQRDHTATVTDLLLPFTPVNLRDGLLELGVDRRLDQLPLGTHLLKVGFLILGGSGEIECRPVQSG